jgi:hypothetical protein
VAASGGVIDRQRIGRLRDPAAEAMNRSDLRRGADRRSGPGERGP